jgi:hypothetical protein
MNERVDVSLREAIRLLNTGKCCFSEESHYPCHSEAEPPPVSDCFFGVGGAARNLLAQAAKSTLSPTSSQILPRRIKIRDQRNLLGPRPAFELLLAGNAVAHISELFAG